VNDGEIIPAIAETAARISTRVDDTAWYLFGSFLRNPRASADIDLLVVCASDIDAALVRMELRDLCTAWPLHITIMTKDEASETDFAKSEGCRQIYPSPGGTGVSLNKR
jgi:predicted nucleotidyltransferase